MGVFLKNARNKTFDGSFDVFAEGYVGLPEQNKLCGMYSIML